jgi:AraC family transcriptional regulator, transcriptional activator of pobA
MPRSFASEITTMSKRGLPTYSIQNLNEVPLSTKDFMADYFAKYLDEHKNLHFPHKHSFYHLVYFSIGSGNHSIDFVNFSVEAGQIYFMNPGQVHSWNFSAKPDGYIVNFSEQYINALIANSRYTDQFSFFSGIANQQVISIPKEERTRIEEILKTVVQEGNSQNILKDDFARTALIQLFIFVSRYTNFEDGKEKSNYNSVVLHNFQRLIEQHYKEKKLTKDYAAILFVTPNHLNAVSKDATGRSAGELIRDRILLEAKRLLINAKMSISEIAFELDFKDNSYFTKFFKKYEGVAPETFRKQFIKK